MPTTPVAIVDVDRALLEALEEAFGPPIDSYLMGWQVWLVDTEIAGADVTLEYRLHPPAGFAQPHGLDHHDLWTEVIVQLADGDGEQLTLGDEQRRLTEVFDLLEVYPAFGEDLSARDVAGHVESSLGRAPRAAGDVDHERLGGRWKRQRHDFDLPNALRAALGQA